MRERGGRRCVWVERQVGLCSHVEKQCSRRKDKHQACETLGGTRRLLASRGAIGQMDQMGRSDEEVEAVERCRFVVCLSSVEEHGGSRHEEAAVRAQLVDSTTICPRFFPRPRQAASGKGHKWVTTWLVLISGQVKVLYANGS